MKRLVLVAIGLILIIAASLALWGSRFATNFVHDQLVAQKISFPDKATLEKDNPTLVKYAGQAVDNSEKAKAYSDYIAGHLKNVAGGKTYSEVSSEYQKDRSNQTLAAQRQTLFMGETLRGLLLNAWGWGLVGSIAGYAAIALYVAGAATVVAAFFLPAASAKKRK
jgi:hypothetical protein